MLMNAWTPVKVIFVQYEFDELNIDITKSSSNSSNYSFVKITRCTVDDNMNIEELPEKRRGNL